MVAFSSLLGSACSIVSNFAFCCFVSLFPARLTVEASAFPRGVAVKLLEKATMSNITAFSSLYGELFSHFPTLAFSVGRTIVDIADQDLAAPVLTWPSLTPHSSALFFKSNLYSSIMDHRRSLQVQRVKAAGRELEGPTGLETLLDGLPGNSPHRGEVAFAATWLKLGKNVQEKVKYLLADPAHPSYLAEWYSDDSLRPFVRLRAGVRNDMWSWADWSSGTSTLWKTGGAPSLELALVRGCAERRLHRRVR